MGGHVPAVEVRQGCNGMLAAMELACGYLAADGRTAALITGADNFGTPLVDRWRYASAAAVTGRASILGDAGAAAVLSRRDGFARLSAIGSTSLPELEEMYRGDTPVFPPDCTVARPLDLGARITWFAEHRPEAFARAKVSLVEARTALAERTLADAGISAADVTRATHVFSGGRGYIESILDPLGIDAAKGILEFGRGVGHLGTCDHVAGLNHLLETGQLVAGDHVLLLSNAVGIALSCAVIEILHPPHR